MIVRNQQENLLGKINMFLVGRSCLAILVNCKFQVFHVSISVGISLIAYLLYLTADLFPFRLWEILLNFNYCRGCKKLTFIVSIM